MHDRMPVMLEPGQSDTWLDPDNHDIEHLKAMLVPCSPDGMESYPVSPVINSGRVEGRECISPIEAI
jgi:putative SOS response-associated peptidase YedK